MAERLARLMTAGGASEGAAELLGAVIAHPAIIHLTRERVQAFLHTLALPMPTCDQPTIDTLIDRMLRDGALPTRSAAA